MLKSARSTPGDLSAIPTDRGVGGDAGSAADGRGEHRFFIAIGVPRPGDSFKTLLRVTTDIEKMKRVFVETLRYEDIPVAENLTANQVRDRVTEGLLGDQEGGYAVAIYFSGHALMKDGTLYLVMRGTTQHNLGGSALPALDLVQGVVHRDPPPTKVWLILDCCSAAAGLGNWPDRADVPIFGLAACAEDSVALDGRFASAFTDAFSSSPDDEGFDRFSDRVAEALKRHDGADFGLKRKLVNDGGRFDFLRRSGNGSDIGTGLATSPVHVGTTRVARRPGRSRTLQMIGGCGVLLLAALLARGGARPPSGMIEIAGATTRLGTDAAAAEAMHKRCVAAQLPRCGSSYEESPFARQVTDATTTVATFWLDPVEVSNRRFVEWLNGRLAGLARERRELWHGPGALLVNHDRLTMTAVNDDTALSRYDIRCGFAGDGVKGCEVLSGRDDLPATHVSWYAAEAFCQDAGGRLPIQDEWELAARGSGGRSFPWGGGEPVSCREVSFASDDQRCNASGRSPAPVGTSPLDRTPEGVRDLAGNVTEWTSTKFAPVSDADRALCGSIGCRVARGGSFAEDKLWLNPAIRTRFCEEDIPDTLGFRCAWGRTP